jgi:hypothetical protein
VSSAAPPAAAARSAQAPTKKEARLILPSYDEHKGSPQLADAGVAARLEPARAGRGEPAILRGAYLADAALIRLTGDTPLAWVRVIAIRRDAPGVFSRAAREEPQVAQARPRGIPVDPSARSGGWFSLDLRAHLSLPPGRYWVLVALGDHVTEKMALELSD